MNYPLEEQLLTLRAPQTTRKQFRESLTKVGEYLAIDIAKDLNPTEYSIKTKTGETATHTIVAEKLALVAVLRAGLPLYQGLQNVFAGAESGFIGSARNEETLEPTMTYAAIPSIQNRKVIVADTMLGTGGTMVDTIDFLKKRGPEQIYVAAAIASRPGLDIVREAHPDVKLYIGATDPKLNGQGFILPGLGDAGDRCYGAKID